MNAKIKALFGIIILIIIGTVFFQSNTAYKPSQELLDTYKEVKNLSDTQDYEKAEEILTKRKKNTSNTRELADIDTKLAMVLAVKAVNTRTESKLVNQARSLIAGHLENYADPELFYTAGYIEEIAGAYNRADQFYSNALTLDPNNAKYLFQKGHNHELSGNLAEAAIWYNKALELDPQNTMAQTAVAKMQWRNGSSDEAIQSFEHIAATLTDSRLKSEAYANISDMLQKSNGDEDVLKKSLGYANKAIETDSKFPFAYVVKAQALLRINQDLDEAYNAALQAILFNSKQAAAYLALAEIQFSQGEFNAALDNLDIFENTIEEDLTIMPEDYVQWYTEAAAKKVLYLLALRSGMSNEALFSIEEFQIIDSEISLALEKLQEQKNEGKKAILLSIIKKDTSLYNLVKDDFQWAQFEMSFSGEMNNETPEALKDLLPIPSSTTVYIEQNDITEHQSKVAQAIQMEEVYELENTRAKLSRQFLTGSPLFAKTFAEKKQDLSSEEVQVYESILSYFNKQKDALFQEISEDTLLERSEELQEIQKSISALIEEKKTAELYAIMADFQDYLEKKEKALEYMNTALSMDPYNIRYIARVLKLSEDEEKEEELKYNIEQAFYEKEELYYLYLQAQKDVSEEELLAVESQFRSNELKSIYYRYVAQFYSQNENTEKAQEFEQKAQEAFNPFEI